MERSKVVVMFDNGHAQKTPGKCSPIFSQEWQKKYGMDRFREYKYNRKVVSALLYILHNKYGIEVFDVVPEETEDISLTNRAYRANTKIKENTSKGKKSLFVSVHVNAASNGEWKNATGWSVWTTKGKTLSDDFAECLYQAAKEILPKYGKKTRQDLSDGDGDYEENFTVIYKTNCPAILTENFFQDNKEDVEWLLSEEGFKAIVDIHVQGILRYIDKM